MADQDKTDGIDQGKDDNEIADWTIMVYMAGDNNLSEDMAFSLSEMNPRARTVSPGDSSGDATTEPKAKVNLLAFFDSNSYTVPTHYIDFSGDKSESHVVTPDDLYHPHKEKDRDGNHGHRDPESSGTAYSILNFVHWCIETQKRKASNYAIIFSGHSFGFYGKSFLGDQSSGSYMTLRKLRWVLEQSMVRYLGPEKIAIVGFDSCEMGMLEVGYELNTAVHTLVASEGNLPGSGWSYAPLLKGFFEDPKSFVDKSDGAAFDKLIGRSEESSKLELEDKKLDSGIRSLGILTPDAVKTLAKWFVRAFVDQQAEYAIGGRSVDMAAWDLDVIYDLADKVGDLGDALLNGFAEPLLTANEPLPQNDAIVFNHVKSAILQSRVNCQTYMHEQAVDLKDFCQFLMAECYTSSIELEKGGHNPKKLDNIVEVCGQIITEINNTILAGGFVGDAYQFSNGISLFLPWTAMTYRMASQIYPELRFVHGERYTPYGKPPTSRRRGPGSGWNDLLAFYLFNVTLRRSRVRPEDFIKKMEKLKECALEGLAGINTRENLHLDETMFPAEGSASDDRPHRERFDRWTRENWIVRTRENWLIGIREDWRVKTKEDWRVKTKEDWRLKTKEDWRVKTKEDWRLKTKENWKVKTKEQLSDSIEAFDGIKNFQLNWEAFGYWDDEGCSVGSKGEFADDTPPAGGE